MARVLAEAGRKVLVLERRSAPGGNVRCETDPETGIEVHVYGSHIFHTHIDRVWDFVRRFVEFNGYQHKVLARHAGKTYFLPLGLTLVNQFYGLDLTPAELPAFIAAESGRGAHPRVPANFEEQAISFIGKPLYDAFIREYTRKQWGTDPRNLGADIIKRLPVRASYDVNYYSDYRQGIPLTGYNSLFGATRRHAPYTKRLYSIPAPSTPSSATSSVRFRGGRSALSGSACRWQTSKGRAWSTTRTPTWRSRVSTSSSTIIPRTPP